MARGEMMSSWRGSCEDVPAELVTFSERNRPELRRGERVSSVHIEIRASDAMIVSFRVAGVDGEIEVRDGAVERTLAPGLGVRWVAMASAAVAALGWSLLLLFAYVFRAPQWFGAQPSALGLVLLAVVLPALAAWLAADLCLPRWRILPRALASGGLVAVLAAQGQLACTGMPSMTAAEAAFAAEDLDGASRIAHAALELGVEPEAAGKLIDRIARSRFEAQGDIALAAQIIAGDFSGEAARVSAAGMLLDRVEAKVAADLDQGNDASAAALVALLPEPQRSDPRARSLLATAALLRFDRCVDRLDAACAKTAIDEARAQGALTEHIDAHRARADIIARSLVEPLWKAIRSRKNPRRARWEACAASLAPLGLAEAAGTEAFQPKRQQVDASCTEIAATDRAR